jgi:voltage-dependent calcium channel T type alpha-1G
MYNGVDAVDVGMQPRRNYSEAKSIYFVSFILIVAFFFLNMFVGVVIENFHKCQAQQELKEADKNKEKRAKKLKRNQRLTREFPYYAHFSPWRKRLHDLCISNYFDLSIAVIIGLNVVTMSLEFYRMPSVRN